MDSFMFIFTSISDEDIAKKREDRDRYLQCVFEKYEEIGTLTSVGDVERVDILRREITFLRIAVDELTFLLENRGR
jgi:hypothetical protein